MQTGMAWLEQLAAVSVASGNRRRDRLRVVHRDNADGTGLREDSGAQPRSAGSGARHNGLAPESVQTIARLCQSCGEARQPGSADQCRERRGYTQRILVTGSSTRGRPVGEVVVSPRDSATAAQRSIRQNASQAESARLRELVRRELATCSARLDDRLSNGVGQRT